MAKHAHDPAGGNKDQMDLLEVLSERSGDKFSMTELTDALLDRVEGVYGWCGLCHSFTEFPHECRGEDQPAEEGAA
jgi:hypothetical protein